MRRHTDRGTILLVVTMMGILLVGAASLYVGAINRSLRQAQRLENRLAASHVARGLFDVTRHGIESGKITAKHEAKGGELNKSGAWKVTATPGKQGFDLRVQVTISRKIPERTIVELGATLIKQARGWKLAAFKETSRVSNPEKAR